MGSSRSALSVFAGLLLISVGGGCSDSPAVDPSDSAIGPDGGAVDASFDASGPADGVYARLYEDVEGDDRTRRFDGFDGADGPDRAIVGTTVYLRGSGLEALTDEQGIAHFPEVSPGTYLFDTGTDRASSHNVAPHLARGVAGGSLKVTTFGDSLPVLGGAPRFDEVLGSHLEALTSIEEVNIAVAGSTSTDWEVGSTYYDRIQTEAADTDLFVVSLGGNDFLYYIQDLFSAGGMDAVIGALDGGAEAEALVILERVLGIITALRAERPDADFVFLLYPNYPSSTIWNDLISSSSPDFGDTAVLLITSEFHAIMHALTTRLEDEDLVLVDLYRQTIAEPIDPFLADEVHFTTFGHRRVAEEIFLSLGGLVVGEDDVLRQPYEVAALAAP